MEENGRNDYGVGVPLCDGGEDVENSWDHHREDDPQGLLYFTRYGSVPIMVDALFDAPSSREYTLTELGKKADLSTKSVSNRIDILENIGVVTKVDGTDRYKLDLEKQITWTLRELDGLIKQAQGSGDPKKRESPSEGQEIVKKEILRTKSSPSFETMTTVRDQVVGHQYAD